MSAVNVLERWMCDLAGICLETVIVYSKRLCWVRAVPAVKSPCTIVCQTKLAVDLCIGSPVTCMVSGSVLVQLC